MNTHTTATTQQEQTTYTDVRCDNVVWDRYRRENRRCDSLLLRLRPGDVLTVPVEVCCRRCNRKQWVGGQERGERAA